MGVRWYVIVVLTCISLMINDVHVYIFLCASWTSVCLPWKSVYSDLLRTFNWIVSCWLEKVSFHSNPQEGQCQECSNYCIIAFISHASKVMLKILQARLQQYVKHEIPDVQAGFRKGRGTRDQISNIHWVIKKSKRVPEKHLFLLYWLCQSLWLCGSQQTVENS